MTSASNGILKIASEKHVEHRYLVFSYNMARFAYAYVGNVCYSSVFKAGIALAYKLGKFMSAVQEMILTCG